MEKTHDIPQIKPASILDPKADELHDIPKITPEQMSATAKKQTPDKKGRRRRFPKKLGIALVAIVAVLAVLSAIVAIPVYGVYKEALVLKAKGMALKDSLATQDISVVKAQLQGFETELLSFQKKYNGISFLKPIPFVGAYVRDGENGILAGIYGSQAGKTVLETIEPYADIIGFKGAASREAATGAENANNRLEFLINTIKDVTPKMGEISEKAALAEAALKKIDPERYPEEFRGMKVRSQLREALTLGEQATSFLARSKPLVENAPYLLGVDEPRTYLLVFQNDSELRPTGGFLSAYSIIEISKGKFRPVSSSDIYILDDKYKPTIPGPDIFPEYLAGIYVANNKLRLRDMNWSPDFKTSMETFLPEAEKAGLDGFDGVIMVDTKVLGNILEVIGRVGVPGFGNFGTQTDKRCNCPEYIYVLQDYTSVEGPVVWSQDEPDKIIFAPPNYGKNRKDVLGVLMNSVLSNTLGQSKEKIPALFQAAWNSVLAKDVQMYMFDEKLQSALEGFNLAGRIQDFEGDYLHVNNANLGGRKSNLYVSYEVAQTFKRNSDGTVEKTVELTYKNPQKYDGWLNSVLPNWTRIYVPKGSTLVKAEGFETPGETIEELGKTVFSGGFKLRPEGVKKVSVTYKLPGKYGSSMPLLIQKQPGMFALHTIQANRQQEEFNLVQDQEVTIRL